MANIVRVQSDHCYPFRSAKTGDVGHDLYVSIWNQNWIDKIVSSWIMKQSIVLWPGQQKVIASGIRTQMGTNLWSIITGRSSAAKRRLHVHLGIIDSGYRGEYMAVVHNFGWLPRVISNGDRIAQVVFMPAVRPTIEMVDHFGHDWSDRGESGFGSTGK